MVKIFGRGRKVSIHHHARSRPETFKAEDSLSQVGVKYRRVCPCCGGTNYKVIPSKLSWLFGQRFKCGKTDYIFKKPWTEKEYQRRGKFSRNRR